MKGQKQPIVGDFFERLGHQIVGGELTRDETADICLWRRGVALEVKSSGYKSSYGFRLDIEQIEYYERASEFPFNRAWYLLFAYRNNRATSGKRRTELAKYTATASIDRYLAGAIQWGVLIDLSIVRRWKETLPRSTKSVMGHLGTETIDLKCEMVHSFSNGGFAEGLKELGLKPAEFVRLSGMIKAELPGNLFAVEFPLTIIMPSDKADSVHRGFNRRGFSLRREP